MFARGSVVALTHYWVSSVYEVLLCLVLVCVIFLCFLKINFSILLIFVLLLFCRCRCLCECLLNCSCADLSPQLNIEHCLEEVKNCSRFMYIYLISRLHERTMVANGRLESETESVPITNGVCGGSASSLVASTGSTDESLTVQPSDRPPLSAYDSGLLPDTASQDRLATTLDDGDVLNGNYVSSGEDQVPSSPTSHVSDESLYMPVTVDTTISHGETPAALKQQLQSHVAAVESDRNAVTDATVTDAKQATVSTKEIEVFQSGKPVCSEEDITSLEASNKTTPDVKRLEFFPVPVSEESVISKDRREIPTEQVGALEHASTDGSLFPSDKTGKSSFVAQETEVVRVFDKDKQQDDFGEGSTEKLPFTVSREKTAQLPEETVTEDLTRKIPCTVPDLQGSLVDQSESGKPGREPQLVDIRQRDAELDVLRPWKIQQQTDDAAAADDDQKYGAREPQPSGTSAAGDNRSLPRDKADDADGFSMSKAVKTGLMAVAAAPYVAGMVITDALRSDTRPSTNVPRSHGQRPTEMRRTPTEDQQRKPLDDRDIASRSSESVDVSEEYVDSSYLASKVPAEEQFTCDDAVSTEQGKEIPSEVVRDNDRAVVKTHVVADGDHADVGAVGRGSRPCDIYPEDEDTSAYSGSQADVHQDANMGTSGKVDEWEVKGDRTVPQQEVTAVMPFSDVSEPSKQLPCDDEGASISDGLVDQAENREATVVAEAASHDRTVPRQEITVAMPSSDVSEPGRQLPCGDEDASISDGLVDQEKRKQAEEAVSHDMSATDLGSIMDFDGEGELRRTEAERDSSVGFPKDDRYDNGVEDEDDKYDLGFHGDGDKVDSAGDDFDDDATSSQVAPRSVKMQETSKGKRPGAKTSTVVCARPPKGSGTRASKTPAAGPLSEAVDTTEVLHGDDSDKNKEDDDRLKHHVIADGREPSVGDGSHEKIPGFDDIDQTPAVDLSAGSDDHQLPVSSSGASEDASRKEPVVLFPASPVKTLPSRDKADVRPDAVSKDADDIRQTVELGKSITATAVKDSQSITRGPEEQLAGAETVSGNTAGPVPDLQGSVVDHSESGRREPQLVDSRQTDAELDVLRPWKIQQQTDDAADNDDQKYGAREPQPSGTSAAGDDRSLPRDKADDADVFSMSKAVKTGLMAVAAAPYVAGMVITDALRSDTRPSTSVPRSHGQHPTEMRRTPTEDQQRKPLDDRDIASRSAVSDAVEDRSDFTKPGAPSQLDKDAVQLVDSAYGRHDKASDMESVNADVVVVDSSVSMHQPRDALEVNFQQPLLEPTSAVVGAKQPASSEIHDDRSAQSSVKLEPLMPVVASTQPLQVTVASTVPTDVATQPSTLSLDSASSTLSSAATPATTASDQLSEESLKVVPSDLDSTEPSAQTTRTPLSTSALSKETPVIAVTSKQPLVVTAQSAAQAVPSSEPFSETSKSTVPSEESTAPSKPTLVTAVLGHPLTVTERSTASTIPLAQPCAEMVISTTTSTELPTSTSATSVPSAAPSAGLSAVASSQPLMVPADDDDSLKASIGDEYSREVKRGDVIQQAYDDVLPASAKPSKEIVQPAASTTAPTQRSETVQPLVPAVPLTQLSTDATQSILPAGGPGSSSIDSLQPTLDVSSVTAISSTSSPVMSEQGSRLSLPASTQEPDVTSSYTVPSAVPLDQTFDQSSDRYKATSHLKPFTKPSEFSQISPVPTHEEQTGDRFIGNEMTSLQNVEPDRSLVDYTAVSSDLDSPELLSEPKKAEPFSDTLKSTLPSEDSAVTSKMTSATTVSVAVLGQPLTVTAQSTAQPSEPEKAEGDDQTTHVTLERPKQYVISDGEPRTSAMLLEEDRTHTALPVDRDQDISGRFQPENQVRDSERSSVAESVKRAVQVGLLGLVGAPVLAGMAVADALKSRSPESQGARTAGSVQDLSTDDVAVSSNADADREHVDTQAVFDTGFQQQSSVYSRGTDDGRRELEPSDDDYSKHRVRSEESDVEPAVTEVQESVESLDEPSASAVIVSTDDGTDHKYISTQAAFDVEGQQQVPIDSRDVGGDRWQQLDTDKEARDEPEIASYQPVIADEVRNDLVGDIPSRSLPELSLSEALLSSLYDQQNNCFIDPKTGRRISLASAVGLGLIDGDSKVIADLSSGEMISVLEALSRGIIDSETGMVSVDGEACVPLNEALASGLIMDDVDGDLVEMAASIGTAGGPGWNDVTSSVGEIQESQRTASHQPSWQPSRPLKLVQMLDLGLYNPESGEFRDPRSADLLSLADTIRCRLLDKDSVVINDPQSEEVLSLEESIRGGLVSGSTSLVHDTSTSENISLTEALRRGILVPRPMSIATAINIGLYDEANGMFFDPTNGLYFALEEAVESGLIDPHSLVIDPATGKAMAVASALACGVLDARHGNVVNIHTGEVIPLKQMAVSSQAVLGSQPVGVSNQVAAVSAAAEEGIKPATGPDVHEVSESRIMDSSGLSSDVLPTPDDGVVTKDVKEDEVLASAKGDSSEIVETASALDVTSEVSDTRTGTSDTRTGTVEGGKMFSDRLHQDIDHVPSAADTAANARLSADKLTNCIVDSADEVAGMSGQAASGIVQLVLPGEQQVNAVAEAAAAHPSGEASVAPVCDESYRAPAGDVTSETPVSDESLKEPVADDVSRESKDGDDSRLSYSDVSSSSTSARVPDQTAGKPFVSDDSGQPISTPVSTTTTSLTVSREFHPTMIVQPEDDGQRMSEVDGVSSTVKLQHILSPLVSTAVLDSPLKADDVDSAGTVELEQTAMARPWRHEMDIISTGMTQAETVEAATRQIPLPDSLSDRVQLERPTQVEFTQADDRGISQLLDSSGPRDIQQLHNVKHIDVEVVSSDVTRTDEEKKMDSHRADVSEDGRQKDDRMKYDVKKGSELVVKSRDDTQQPGRTAVKGEVKTLPGDDGKKEDLTRDDAFTDDAEKDFLEKVEIEKDTVNVAESEDDMQGISDILRFEAKPHLADDVMEAVAIKDEAKRDDLSDDDDLKKDSSKKGVPKKVDDLQKDARNDVEFRDAERLSNVVPIAVKPLPSDDKRKDEGKKDDSVGDNLLMEGTDKDAVQKVSAGVIEKPVPAHDVEKGIAKKHDTRDGDLSEDGSKKADHKKDDAQRDAVNIVEFRDDREQLSSIVQISVKPLAREDVEEGGSTEDVRRDVSVEEEKRKQDEMDKGVVNVIEPHTDVQQLSSILQFEMETPSFDVGKKDEVSDDVKRADASEDGTKKDVASKDGALNVTESRDDSQQLIGVTQVGATYPCGDEVKKDVFSKKEDETKSGDISGDDSGKEIPEKYDARSGAIIAESRDDVQPLSNILQVEVKRLAEDVGDKDDMKKDALKADDVTKDSERKAKTKEEAVDVVRPQDKIAETEAFVDNAEAAREGSADVEQKPSDVVDTLSQRQRDVDVDTDVDEKVDVGLEVITTDVEPQPQQEVVSAADVMSDEEVSAVRRHDDEPVVAEDDNEQRKKDVAVDHDVPVAARILVSTERSCCVVSAYIQELIFFCSKY